MPECATGFDWLFVKAGAQGYGLDAASEGAEAINTDMRATRRATSTFGTGASAACFSWAKCEACRSFERGFGSSMRRDMRGILAVRRARTVCLTSHCTAADSVSREWHREMPRSRIRICVRRQRLCNRGEVTIEGIAEHRLAHPYSYLHHRRFTHRNRHVAIPMSVW